jgi:hypothetical protein
VDEITKEFMALDFGALDADKPAALNLVPNEPQRIRALFEPASSAA